MSPCCIRWAYCCSVYVLCQTQVPRYFVCSCTRLCEGKGEPHPRTDLGARCGWLVKATPRPLYPWERDLAPLVQEAGWAPGPLWTGAENLVPTGIRSPDRPAHSASLCRLSYRGLPKAAVLISAWFFKVKCNREDSLMNFLYPMLFEGTKCNIYIYIYIYFWSAILRDSADTKAISKYVCDHRAERLSVGLLVYPSLRLSVFGGRLYSWNVSRLAQVFL